MTQINWLVELLSTYGALVPFDRLFTFVNLLEVHLHVVAVGEGLATCRTWVLRALVILVMKQNVLSKTLPTFVEFPANWATICICYRR